MKQSHTLRNTIYNGTHGNLSKAVGVADFAGDDADTTYAVLRVEPGTDVYGVKVYHDNLGSGTSIDVGYVYPGAEGTDVADAFVSGGASTSEASKSWEGKPMRFEYPVYLTVTVRGGTASGGVTVIPEYTYLGTK